MRRLITVLIILLITLQYRLWVGPGSLAELRTFKQDLALLEDELVQLRARNQELQAEVVDLSEGEEAVEERARTELGMIKAGEMFIQVLEKQK